MKLQYNLSFIYIDITLNIPHIFIYIIGLSPRVQSNGSNTLPRSSNPLQITESPVKHGPSIPNAAQDVVASVPGGGGSRRSSNTGISPNAIGNTVDASTPSSTPSIPRRSSVGVDGSAKINGRGK